MQEQSTVSASNALIEAFPDHLWEPLGLSVSRSPNDETWTVRASDRVGILRVNIAGTSTQLRVTPKLPGLDLLFLADWAYGSTSTANKIIQGRAELDALRTDPAACLLAWYLAEAVAFATRWVRRGYVSRAEDLVGRVRGQIDVARYVRGPLASSRPHVIPCNFTEPSHDTEPNQYLKAGVRRAATLAGAIPNAHARRFLLELSRRGLALLASVDDVAVTARQGKLLNLAGPLRHYRPIVAFTSALLEGTYLSTEAGAHSQQAILWPLNSLYEQALRNVLASWPAGQLEKPSLRASVVGTGGEHLGGSRVTPDFVLSTPVARLALDAKYKETRTPDGRLESPETDLDIRAAGNVRIRVRRSDIYQTVAYGRHNGLRPASVGLLYPVVLERAESYPPPVRVEGFDPTVHVVFFDVGPCATSHVRALYDVLDSLSESIAGTTATPALIPATTSAA
jgi:5-methylcytosine-specific restriction enzyme subunit McrC